MAFVASRVAFVASRYLPSDARRPGAEVPAGAVLARGRPNPPPPPPPAFGSNIELNFCWRLAEKDARFAGAGARTLAGARTAWWVAAAPSGTRCNARVPQDRHRVSLHAGHCVLDQLSRPDRQHEMSLTRSVM